MHISLHGRTMEHWPKVMLEFAASNRDKRAGARMCRIQTASRNFNNLARAYQAIQMGETCLNTRFYSPLVKRSHTCQSNLTTARETDIWSRMRETAGIKTRSRCAHMCGLGCSRRPVGSKFQLVRRGSRAE